MVFQEYLRDTEKNFQISIRHKPLIINNILKQSKNASFLYGNGISAVRLQKVR